MIDLNKIRFSQLNGVIKKLTDAFNDHLDEKIDLPPSLKVFMFPPSFFDSAYYLLLPYLYKGAFKERNSAFIKDLCISGFFYFKYLLCIDTLTDNDTLPEDASANDDSMILLKSHTYHEEAMKILGRYFGKNDTFWKFWNKRNNEFLSSIMLDKQYNPDIPFEVYQKLSITKCSFAKVAVDAYFARKGVQEETHEAMTKSLDYFAVARCLQDDLEDFKKDIIFEKNNYAVSLLNQWLKTNDKNLSDYSPEILEKYLFISGSAEKVLELSKEFYQKAIDVIEPFHKDVDHYLKIIELLRNTINHFKVNIHAYRINKIIDKVTSQDLIGTPRIDRSIKLSRKYISNMQNNDGSWFDVSNMQGLSNVWSTGYIASFLSEDNECLTKASEFLLNNKQDKLWGYNTDWSSDYDSTTCALYALNKANNPIKGYVKEWLKGQTEQGGFSTYSAKDEELLSRLGLKRKSDVRGWTNDHICVSALAYYFMNHLDGADATVNANKDSLRSYLMENRNKNGVWAPYWWTSFIYPTSYIIQGMLLDKENLQPQIEESLTYMLSRQNDDGSYSCDILGEPSVFYTSMVLDTLCSDEVIYHKYKKQADKMKTWILKNQYQDGAFKGSYFLVIPNPNAKKWSPKNNSFKVNIAGGGNTITGEIASLFSTSVSLRALERYQKLA